jgi:hypothetical protein
MSERLRREFRKASDIRVSPDILERAAADGVRLAPETEDTVSRRATTAVIALLLFAVVGYGSWMALRPVSRTSSFSGGSPTPVLDVACTGGETSVTTPAVEVQSDGVHMEVENPDRIDRLFYVGVPNGDAPDLQSDPSAAWTTGEEALSLVINELPGRNEKLSENPPEAVYVGCFDLPFDASGESPQQLVRVELTKASE